MTPPPPEPAPAGPPTMNDVMGLPEPLRGVVLWLLRHGEAGLSEVTAGAGLEEGTCRELLETLVGSGFLFGSGADGAVRYKVRLAPRRASAASGDIWKRLNG